MALADNGEHFMEEALRLAARAEALGEVPVGALVVKDGAIIGRGWNQVITLADPSAHAELLAIREACRALGNYRLEGCELFVTLEPCAMCAGLIVHSRLARLTYGASDPKAGACGSVLPVLNHPALNHSVETRTGVLAGRCAEQLQAFFRAKR
jgi:tRNA(adenine34) deaminase